MAEPTAPPLPPPFSARPLFIAHRGLGHGHPENTLEAFAAAWAAGTAVVELDVRACADALVVVHDEDLGRVGGRAVPVACSTLATLRRVDLGGGARVPTLQAVLAACPRGCGINVEVKDPEATAAVADLLADCADRVLVSAFDARVLVRLRALAPRLPLGALFHGSGTDGASTLVQRAVGMGAASVHVDGRAVPRDLVSTAHGAGLAVFCYTVNEAVHWAALRDRGVDGVFTDQPRALRDAR